jgi:phosphatidate cytidylyltransferase
MFLRSTLNRRVFFGSLMIVFFAALFVTEGWLSCRNYFLPRLNLAGLAFALLVVLFAGLGCSELGRIARAKGFDPHVPIMILLVVVIITQPFWMLSVCPTCPISSSQALLPLLLMVCLFLAAFFKALAGGSQNSLISLSLSCFAIIYLGLGCWFVLQIRLLGGARDTIWGQIGPLVMFLACVKSCDIGAYFTGKFLGRHKWVPSISPQKTWEGFFGGIAAAMIVASLFNLFSAIMSKEALLPIGRALVFALVVSVTGQLGDLFESMLKRDAGSKDSARLVPEFGGVLDLMDSIIAAAPFAYLIFVWSAGR